MLHALRKSLALLAVGIGVQEACAFSLQGPLASWQTIRLGYDLNVRAYFGGPVNLGEEYRWNVPVVYYAFTPQFLNYFGQTGVTEIEKAVKILNDLPPASQLNLDIYPLTSQRVNHRATALGLIDLKSEALSVMLQQLGICDPTRFVFTLRNRWLGPVNGTPTNYHVIKRNFDPVTWQPSSYINGQLWTYPLVTDVSTTDSFVFTDPVDPLALFGFINAPVSTGVVNAGLLLVGGFWTGLTRDDVGGLKYVYRNNNYNRENAPPNAFSSGGGGGPWGVPGGTTNNVFVNLAVRPGADKIQFVRANYDSLFGSFVTFTNSYTDKYVTNSTLLTQGLQRQVVIADILFDASDLQGPDDPGVGTDFFTLIGDSFQAWTDNAVNAGALDDDLGPGVINPASGIPAFVHTFNTAGPMFRNVWPAFLSEANNFRQYVVWGSFDGTTNEPVVYPIGTSILAIEQQVLSGGSSGGGGPFTVP